MTTLYISGPITGMPERNKPTFNAAATLLRSVGHTVVNPIELGRVDEWEWHDYLKRDLIEMLTKCDAVAVLPGYEDSRGATLEKHVARELKMEIKYFTEWYMQGKLGGVA